MGPCSFSPTVVHVPAGTEVRFLNTAEVDHLVVGESQTWGTPVRAGPRQGARPDVRGEGRLPVQLPAPSGHGRCGRGRRSGRRGCFRRRRRPGADPAAVGNAAPAAPDGRYDPRRSGGSALRGPAGRPVVGRAGGRWSGPRGGGRDRRARVAAPGRAVPRRRARRNRSDSRRRPSGEADTRAGRPSHFDRPDPPAADAGGPEVGLDRRQARPGRSRRAARPRSAGRARARPAPARPRRRRSSAGAVNRRLCAAPPVSTPARARSSAPGSAGSARGVEHEARIGRPRHLEAVAQQPEPRDVGRPARSDDARRPRTPRGSASASARSPPPGRRRTSARTGGR